MKFAKSLGLICGVALLLSCASDPPVAPPPEVIDFHASPQLDASGSIEGLRIEVRFRSDEDGSTSGRFQSGMDDVDNLLATYTDINVDGGVMKNGARPGSWTIEAPPSAPVTLSYVLRSGIDGLPTSKHNQPHAPWIMSDWIYLYGQTTFPRFDRPSSTPATFEWNGPSGLVFASDLEPFSKPGAGGTLDDIIGSKIIAGRDVRVFRDGGVRLAIKGRFIHSDQRLFRAVADIIRTERQFWGDPLNTPYLITLGEIAPELGTTGSAGGMGGGTSSGIAMLPDTPFAEYIQILAHEVFHTWNWFQMGPPETIEDWFNEGFTDYYSRILPLRAGLLSMDEFVADWNGVLLAYARMPRADAAGPQGGSASPRDLDDGYFAYQRGALMAAFWDRRLRAASGGAASLDDAMREIRRRARAGATISPGTQLARIAAEAGVQIESEMEAFLQRGEPITVPADTFGPCLRVQTVTIPTFDRGFDFEASAKAGMVVTGVRTDGPAFAAGVRDGMRIVQRVETHYPDSTREEIWIVRSPGEPEQTLRWYPAGAGTLSTQRIVRAAGAPSDPGACALN